MIRLEAVWMSTAPMDMRAGADTALARVIAGFGAARPHHAYGFANTGRPASKCSCTTVSASGWPHVV